MPRNIALFVFLVFAASFLAPFSGFCGQAETLLEPVRKTIETQKRVQKDNEAWDREKQALTARYKALEKEVSHLEQAVSLLEDNLKQSQKRADEKKDRLEQLSLLSQAVGPFVKDTADQLKNLEWGAPLWMDAKRNFRIARLYEAIADPQLTDSQKLGLAIDALLQEMEAGHNVELFQETIEINGVPVLADVLRMGRLSAFYSTLDRTFAGFYNPLTKRWESVASSEATGVHEAMDIAAKKKMESMVMLPVGRIAAP